MSWATRQPGTTTPTRSWTCGSRSPAAELSRVAVELNARIAEVAGSTGTVANEDAVGPIPTPDLDGDESFVDLTADSPARAHSGAPTGDSPGSGRRTSGWQPAG